MCNITRVWTLIVVCGHSAIRSNRIVDIAAAATDTWRFIYTQEWREEGGRKNREKNPQRRQNTAYTGTNKENENNSARNGVGGISIVCAVFVHARARVCVYNAHVYNTVRRFVYYIIPTRIILCEPGKQ